MTCDQQSLSLAIFGLVMVAQIFLMGRWHRAMQREGRAVMAESEHAMRAWTEQRERCFNINRELAFQAGRLQRLELAMAEFLDGEAAEPLGRDDQQKQTTLGLQPNTQRTPSAPAVAPEFVCGECGAEVFFQAAPGPCPVCGSARPLA